MRSAAGPVALGVAIGIDALLALLVLVAPPTVSRELLTVDGIHNVRPERDTFIYLGAGAIAVGAALLLRRLAPWGRPYAVRPRAAQWLPTVVGAGAVVVATSVFLAARRMLPLGSAASAAYLVLSIVLAAACVVVAKATVGRSAVVHQLGPDADRPRARPRLRPGLPDVAVALVVIGIVYLPGWSLLAGNAFAGEGSLHLDFFAFGPALAFKEGLSLGTDLATYYGVGWPVVFAALDPLSYSNIIRLEVVYGCAYFIGVNILLRVLVGDRRWAAAGTVLAIFLQLFAGFPSYLIVWRFPSATVMRWPFDVWFFLACALHLRTGRTGWTVAAGACVALAVVFETDSGLALGIAFALFWVGLWRLEGRRSLRRLARAAPAAAAVLIGGLGVASRWTLFSGDFRSGWLENLRLSAKGATLLPLTTEPPARSIVLFILIAVTYLVVLTYTVVRIADRRLSRTAVMLGCIALYGFVTLLYFVGRSNPFNLFRPAVPFAILVAALGGLAHRAWLDRAHDDARARGRLAGGAAWAALGIAVAMLVAHPGARAYPGLIRSAVTTDPEPGVCLFEDPDDICGLPVEAQQSVDDLHALASRLRALGSAAESVAVLDEIGPVIQAMAGARPWGRYLPVFPGLFTRAQLETVVEDLREHPPALVVMRPRAEDRAFYADMWRAVRVPVERGFVLDSQEGLFEIWRRR